MNKTFLKLTLGIALGFTVFAANAIDGSDISVVVLQDDSSPGDDTCIFANSKAGRMISSKIGEQFRRYGYSVIPRDVLAAEGSFDLNQPLDRSMHIEIVRGARSKSSKKPELDIKALVTYRLDCAVKNTGVSLKADVSLSGNILDTEAQRELGDFGPIEFPLVMDKNASRNKIEMELASRSADIATQIADEARKKLALITKKSKADGSSGRMVTYAIRLENLSKNASRIRSIMEKQFPGAVGITSLKSSGTLVSFGYKSTASSDKIQDWLQVVVDDLGMENVSLEVDGINIKIRNDGDDLPARKKPVERIFE